MLFTHALLNARKSYSASFSLPGILSLIVFTLIIFICTTSAFAAQATLSWDSNSESDLAGYKVHYGVSSGNYDTIVDVGNQTSYTILDLVDGNTYYFAATTYDLSGNESNHSAEVVYDVPLTDTTSPSIPTNLSAMVISESQIDISWNISTDDVRVTGYNVYRDSTLITTTTNTSYQDTGLNQSTTYAYTASAYDAAGNESGQSLTALATTTLLIVNNPPVLNPIANITVSEGETVTITPTATDQDGDALTYTYSGWMTLANYTTGYQDAGTHTVTVTVSDGTLTDSQSVTITVNSLNQAPVLNPIADVTVNEGDTISFNPTATDSDGDALAYTYSGWMTSVSYTTGYGDAGTHTVTVTVSDGLLFAAQDVTIVVNGGDTTSPSTPGNLLSTAISETQIDISWDISTDDVGVTGYLIYRDGILISTTADTGHQDTGLSVLTSYTYTVSAFDAAGNVSAQSLAASATTLDAALTQVTTVIHVGDTWKYFKGYSYPGTGWNDVSFNDLAWNEGPSGIGYGDGDDATILSDMRRNYLTVYARKTFEVSDTSTVTGMTLMLDYDDGFVAYLNGQELVRAHMPSGIPDCYTRARRHNAGTPKAFDLSSYTNYLISGTNVLSIEIHNSNIRSRNLSMIPELEIEGLIGGGPRATDGQASTIAQAAAGSLILDIKANNSDGPITIGADENLSVEISLSDEGYVGKECDWWVVVSTPSGIQYLDLDKGFVSDLTVTHQGVIFDLGPTTIFNTSGLDAGTYVYYFGIDLDMNGELDMDEGMFYYDSVEVRVEDGSGNKYADTDELLPPTGFSVLVSDNTLTLSWDAVSGAEGYTLYYGTSTGDYTGTFDLGNSTGMVFEDMPEGTYYLAITAYAGPDESGDSEEIGVTVSE